MSQQDFMDLFKFNPLLAGNVGVERECFVTTSGGVIVPAAPSVLAQLPEGMFGYELSACQVESRVGPHQLADVEQNLQHTQSQLYAALESQRLKALHVEVGPSDMPLDIYPDPTGRYQRITQHMPQEVLLAACRVIGTHVHIGMRNHEEALRVYNYVTKHYAELCELGNGSFGERLAIYRTMAPHYLPTPYTDWSHYYDTACEQGFEEDPRKCWTLIRISIHGTIEFRMFGATSSIPRIMTWVNRCHELCNEALQAF